MFQFLPAIYLDFYSFWIGFFTGILFILLYRRAQPWLNKTSQNLQNQFENFTEKNFFSSQNQFRQVTYEYAQDQHLASRLFPLQDIIIPPRFLAPPPPAVPGDDEHDPTILQQSVPFLPDYPSLAAAYQYPTYSLEEAAPFGANLLVIGKPGYGKTVALAHFASKMAKGELLSAALNQCLPILINAHNLLPHLPSNSPVETIVQSLESVPLFLRAGSIRQTVIDSLKNNQAFLLLDSTDELPAPKISLVVQFLNHFQGQYPEIQIAAAASPQALNGFLAIGFKPVVLAGWSSIDRKKFNQKWSEIWKTLPLLKPVSFEDYEFPPSYFLNSWLSFSPHSFTPLEYTLKVWAAYADDLLGPGPKEAVESHLRRTAVHLPHVDLITLQIIAYASLLEGNITFSKQTINRWTKKSGMEKDIEFEDAKSNPLSKLLLTCEENQLLTRHTEGNYSFSLPTTAGFLASKAILRIPDANLSPVLNQPDWSLRYETLRYLDITDNLPAMFDQFIEPNDIFEKRLLLAGEWLKFIEKDSPFRERILRAITQAIHKSPLLETKTRLVTILANSGDPQVSSIFRHLLKSPKDDIRHAVSLGAGYIRDYKAVEMLISLLPSSPPLSYAACFALINIGTPPALEAVANVLLSADELTRRAAASALANHPVEGHPALKDGSQMEDLMVRYAVVHGLKRINKRWAVEILDKMRIDESEWIVRDAAQQAYEELLNPPPSIPKKEPALENAPWLIAFSSESGVSSSKDANDINFLLVKALKEGTDQQKSAALYHLRSLEQADVLPAIYPALFSSNPGVRREASLTLWYLAASGLPANLPPEHQVQ